jgi:hypothetical protein
MAMAESFKRGDEVLSKLPNGSIMKVLAVEGLKVRCSDEESRQYWFDTILLERYHSKEAFGQDSLSRSLPEATMCRSSSERQQ